MYNLNSFEDDELLAIADNDFKNGRLEQALSKLKILMLKSSTPIVTYAIAGNVYAALGLLERAKSALQFYIDNSESDHKINEQFRLGLIEYDLGNVDDAITIWDTILQNTPNFPPALFHKANALIKKDQIQDGVNLLNHILETAEDGDKHIALADELLNRVVLH